LQLAQRFKQKGKEIVNMRKTLIMLVVAFFLTGCATFGDFFKLSPNTCQANQTEAEKEHLHIVP